ncbi:glutathione peroxidase [Phycisphaerales bacterium]|nr:glutathione peroxidase [Phycisphaerales bacterium]
MRILSSNVSRSLATAVAGLAGACGLAGLAWQPEKPKETEKPAQPAPAPAPQAQPEKPGEKPAEPPAAPDPYVLGFTIPDIDGKDQDLAQWKGKVILIVNTASKCGYTKQYTALEEVYQAKKDKGFVVLAFPSGDFANQEFEDNAKIKQFCTVDEFKVTFPLFGRLHVKGEHSHPLFKKLVGQAAPIGGDPKWNFTKWLIDRNGNVVNRFDFRVSPTAEDVTKKIDDLLAGK